MSVFYPPPRHALPPIAAPPTAPTRPTVRAEMDKVREPYDRALDADHAAAGGLVDAVVTPEKVRDSLILALQTCLNTSTPHIGAFVLPNFC